MTQSVDFNLIENNLNYILGEMRAQPEVSQYYPMDGISYFDHLSQMGEFIDEAGEYGLAYECMVGALEIFPFKLTGLAAIKLLEVGLLMGFKSDQEVDRLFDRRLI
ncbi:hypothetical protein [Burkholderia gladioli]|uniref:hypothetical protein n=1 Tax=Burkholderia gladioli TaxID=28095 RepID=UPI001641F52B|nr:hypothetical protein [Burkholderia gladioli]